MGNNCLMDGYQYKTLIKHLIKSIMTSRQQQKQLFYGLSVHLSTPVCFSRQQLKSKVITADGSVVPFYIIIVRHDRCFIMSASLFDLSDSNKQ